MGEENQPGELIDCGEMMPVRVIKGNFLYLLQSDAQITVGIEYAGALADALRVKPMPGVDEVARVIAKAMTGGYAMKPKSIDVSAATAVLALIRETGGG